MISRRHRHRGNPARHRWVRTTPPHRTERSLLRRARPVGAGAGAMPMRAQSATGHPAPATRTCWGTLLLAGHADTGELIYLGDVGTGFPDAARRHLLQVLRPLQRTDSPFSAEFLRA